MKAISAEVWFAETVVPGPVPCPEALKASISLTKQTLHGLKKILKQKQNDKAVGVGVRGGVKR